MRGDRRGTLVRAGRYRWRSLAPRGRGGPGRSPSPADGFTALLLGPRREVIGDTDRDTRGLIDRVVRTIVTHDTHRDDTGVRTLHIKTACVRPLVR